MQRLVKIIACLGAVLALGSYAGGLHPVGDSLAVFRVPLLALAALALIWTSWPRRVRWGGSGLMMLGIVPLVLARWETNFASDYDFVLYQQNMLWTRTNDAAFLAEVAARNPDFLTLQEVSPRNDKTLEALRETYPYQHQCGRPKITGEAVVSRIPFVPDSAQCSRTDGYAAVQLDSEFGHVWVVSLHLSWPWPFPQARQAGYVAQYLAELEGPIILAGDFNSVAWSHTLRLIEDASRTRRVGPHQSTFHLPYTNMAIGIDHVLSSSPYAQEVRLLPKYGSDHRGLLAYLTRPEGVPPRDR